MPLQFDFDLISEKNILSKTLEAFGCEGENKKDLISLWEKINSEVKQQITIPSLEEFKQNFLNFITATPADKLSKGKVEKFFKQKKSWNDVKEIGVDGLPKGNIRKTFKEFDNKLKQLGIFLIPVGEIENFCAEIGFHGPAFVEKFLLKREVGDIDLNILRDFVHEVYIVQEFIKILRPIHMIKRHQCN